MVGVSIALFMMHKRSRAKKLREIRAYFREQTSYRNSIITMHSHAKSRLSTYSLVSSRHSQADSLSQFGALGTRESFEEDEDNDRRGLLARRSSEEHPEHQQDSDDEGVGYVHQPQGGGVTAPTAPPRARGGWNPGEWGMRR